MSKQTDTKSNFRPVRAIVLDPIHPFGEGRDRKHLHPNAIGVWRNKIWL